MEIQYKNISEATTLDVDDKSRRVKVVISQMGSIDHDNDIIDYSAYNKTIAERGPGGKNKIYHLTDHKADLKNSLGKFSELYVEGNKLVGINNIVKTAWGNDVLEMYKADVITEHSVGIQVLKSIAGEKGGPRVIKEVRLFEGSAVLLGSNENTPTLSVGKSLADIHPETILKSFDALKSLLKSGDLSEDGVAFIEIKILQIESEIKSILTPITTPAASNAPEPDELKRIEWQHVLLNILN